MTSPRILTCPRGAWINPLNPNPELIHIEDIAHALSMVCRFTGHVRRFRSVAAHSLLVCDLVSPAAKLAALLHDASEAYLHDLSAPIKEGSALGLHYREAEARVQAAIYARFGLPPGVPDEVRRADVLALRIEQAHLTSYFESIATRAKAAEALRLRALCQIPHETPGQSEAQFLARFTELTAHACR